MQYMTFDRSTHAPIYSNNHLGKCLISEKLSWLVQDFLLGGFGGKNDLWGPTLTQWWQVVRLCPTQGSFGRAGEQAS